MLRRPAEPATSDEISAAALQFVRKVSGFRKPSRTNEKAFDAAVLEIAGSVERLLASVGETNRASTSPVRKRGGDEGPAFASKPAP